MMGIGGKKPPIPALGSITLKAPAAALPSNVGFISCWRGAVAAGYFLRALRPE